MLNKILKVIFPILMIVFGIMAIVSGAHKLQTKDLYDASATAVITGIEREWIGTDEDGFDEYNYHVWVDYEVDGKTYEHVEYPGYDSSMKDGDEIEIRYQSANPEEISEANITGNAAIIIVVGSAMCLIGAFLILKSIFRR